MKPEQEPKYVAVDGKIVNRASGLAIPDNEPVFILRARDVFAVQAISAYSAAVQHLPDHQAAVDCRIADFTMFRIRHPELMKEPDTAQPTKVDV